MDIRPLANLERQFAPLLQPDRREKMRRYLLPADRLRCLAGGLLLERIVHGRQISYGKYGKPFLQGGPHFNLSHAGDYACLAVCAEVPIGIDIEMHREADYLALGKTTFHPEEMTFLLENPTPERFYSIWTLKESYAKMIGSGFSIEPSSYCVLPEKLRLSHESKFFFQTFDIFESYTISICAPEPISAVIELIDPLKKEVKAGLSAHWT